MAELEAKLRKRLSMSIEKRENQQTQIRKLQAALQRLLNKIPRRPRETLVELDKKIDDLELKRTEASLSLAEERQILKQSSGLMKSKVQVQEYNNLENQIQELKIRLNELRDGQKILRESIEELETAKTKVILANQVGCSTKDLITDQLDCPKEKLGMVIGKNGSMVKQISDKCKVAVDVDKGKTLISITGSPESVEHAKVEIDRIIRAVDVEIIVPRDLLSYFASKHVNVIAGIKAEYEDLYIELLRKSSKAIFRGTPERVEEAKREMLSIKVVSKDRNLTGREFNHLLGKKGTTIDRLVASHKVSIDVQKVNDNTAIATVIGPSDHVEDTMDEIDLLMNENREVTEAMPIDAVVKRILLAEGGKHIKSVQSKVNVELDEIDASCYLSFPKDRSDRECPELLVKAKHSVIAKTLELTEKAMADINILRISMTADIYVIPYIIGKGGDTIKKLTRGKSAFLEVDRGTGKIVLGASTVEERDALHSQVKQMIEDNKIVRVSADPAMMKAQYLEMGRTKTKMSIQELAWLDLDEENAVFVLRGKDENLENAKKLLNEFVANCFFDEIAFLEEDQDVLLSGGKNSKIMKLSEEMNVNLFADRSRHVVTIRGPNEKVVECKRRLDIFLNGGQGHSVARLAVTDQVAGAIIGKGGKTRKELETKFSPVSIHISKANRVAIRGPECEVSQCRVEVLKIISSVRVTHILTVSSEQEAKMKKNDAIRRIIQQSHAQVTVAEGKVTVRGLFQDVRHALSLVDEQLTGEFKSSIELDASQLTRVSATCRDTSHFQRVEDTTEAKVSLDKAAGSIQVSGKRNNVRRAKEQIFGFLAFVCPGEIDRLKLSKPLYAIIGQPDFLAETAASVGGLSLYLDRDIGSIVIRDLDIEKVEAASKLVAEKIQTAERLAYVLEIPPSEAWLLSYIVGTKGTRIQSLQKNFDCRIDVSKESRTVTVMGESEAKVAETRKRLDTLVEKAKRENVFIDIPEKAIAGFVGKGGSNVKELAREHAVDIQRVRRGSQFKITGDEAKVEAIKEKIDVWLKKWEQSNNFLQITIDKESLPAILGAKGETVRALQEDFGCRINVDRHTLEVAVRGESEECRVKTIEKIKQIIEEAKTARDKDAEEKESQSSPSIIEEAKTNGVALALARPDDAATSSKKNGFPSLPIGVQATNGGKSSAKSSAKKSDTSLQRGTEQGRDLFNLLLEED